MGCIRLRVALGCSAYSLETFILHHVKLGSTIATDALQSYNFIADNWYRHEPTNQSKSLNFSREMADS